MDEQYLGSIGKVWTVKEMPKDIIENEIITKVTDSVSSILSSKSSKSVLITGEAGVGKSTLVQLISRHLKRRSWFIFSATAGNLLAGQRYIGDLELNVQRVVSELTSKDKSLWIVPRFQELYYSGRHEYSPVGILDQILPSIDSGRLKVLGEIDSKNLERIIQFRPQILSTFEIVRIETSDKDFTLNLAKDWIASNSEKEMWSNFSDSDLEEVYYLANQYLPSKENPGCLMDLLKQTKKTVLSKKSSSTTIQLPDFIESLSNTTGMPSTILDDSKKLDLDKLQKNFFSKVLGQEEAVKIIVERIAMIKAGLTDPKKPAGVFLFVGPTGTGKTEIAKTLSEYLFGSEDKLIRLDMSEFQTVESTYKILGNASDLDENSALVNTVRKKPFSVILLDEFEKAHPNIWDLFLQVFDDGRLTDQRGGVADFRHSIIILTSNLGASISTDSKIGFNSTGDDINSNVIKTISDTFRPEFVNRIDRIVIFKPLTKSTAKKILKNELKRILNRRGLRRRNWEIDFEDSALEFLLEKGFSSTLGARPIKRAIEKYLLAPLAQTIVNHDFPKGNQFLLVSPGKNKLRVDFIDPDEPQFSWEQKKQIISAQTIKSEKLDLRTIISEANGILSEFQAIKKELLMVTELLAKKKLSKRKDKLMRKMSEPEFWSTENRFEILNEVEFLDRLYAGFETADKLFKRLDNPDQERLSFDPKLISKLAQRIYLLKCALTSYSNGEPQDAFVRISFGDEDEKFAVSIESMYQKWSRSRGMRMERIHEVNDPGNNSKYYSIFGFGAYLILQQESGFHVQEVLSKDSVRSDKRRVRISVIPVNISDYRSMDISSIDDRMKDLQRPKTVRKFILGKSPIVKDNSRDWQTGKLEYILEGNFDLL